MPSFKAQAVLFSDLQNSCYVKQHNVGLPFEYLVRCSIVQLCVASERGRDTASPSALYHWTGLTKVGVTGNHCTLCQSAYK